MPADLDMVASIAKGKELFYGNKANCVKCHGVSGLGDGQANDYDDWNKVVLQAQKTVDGGVKQAEKASTWDMSAEERDERLGDGHAELLVAQRDVEVLLGGE